MSTVFEILIGVVCGFAIGIPANKLIKKLIHNLNKKGEIMNEKTFK